MVRKTREHPDIKLGASIRGAIDVVDLFVGMQKLDDQPDSHFLTTALMAISNKIWLNEMASKTADEIIEEVYASLRNQYPDLLRPQKNGNAKSSPDNRFQEKESEEEQRVKKKIVA